MGFSPAEAILAVLLLAAITTGLSLMAQIRRLRAGHETFRRALGQSATVLATAEGAVRDLSVHGSQMLVALDHAIAEAREVDRSLSFYIGEVRSMPWLPPLPAAYQARLDAPQPAVAYPRPAPASPPPAQYAPPPVPQAARPAPADPAPFHPAFVPQAPPMPAAPAPSAVVETLADRLKARVAGQAGNWGTS
jgi:hypothetical protein